MARLFFGIGLVLFTVTQRLASPESTNHRLFTPSKARGNTWVCANSGDQPELLPGLLKTHAMTLPWFSKTARLVSATQLQPPPGGQGPFYHQIYSASSADGLTFTHDNRLLLDHASVPAAIVTPEGKIRIYYVDATQQPETTNCAESSDGGLTFNVLGCTISGLSADKALDPSIVQLPDGRYRLYYFGSAHPGQPPGALHTIYSAISRDGVHFTEEGAVFSYPGLVDPDVFWTGQEWLMFVFAGNGTIVARSRDGLSFQYVGPLSVQNWGTTAPVKLNDGRFRLYAFDQPAAQCVASFISSDGLNWTQEPGVRLTAPPGYQLTDPFVIRLPDDSWKMIYKVSPRLTTPQPPPNPRTPRRLLLPANAPKLLTITVDPTNNQGTFNSLNGAYGSGYSPQPDFPHVSDLLNTVGIKFLRFPQDDGFAFTLATIFPNQNAPVDSLSSYNFANIDAYMQEIEKTGAGRIWTALYDVGGGDRWVGPNNFQGGRCPQNPELWAQVVVNVIRHFNDGWGAARPIPVEYVECLNEPLGLGGCTLNDYLRVYKAFSQALSAYSASAPRPVKLIGFGEPIRLPQSTQEPDATKLAIFREFSEYVKDNALALDMVSIHPYDDSPYRVYQLARLYRQEMDNAGWQQKNLVMTEYGSISSVARPEDDLYTLSRKLAAFQTVAKVFLQGTVKIATGDRVVPSGDPYAKPYLRLGGTLFFTTDRRMLPAIQAVKMLTLLEESFPTIVYWLEPNAQNVAVVALKSPHNLRLAILMANASWDTWQINFNIPSLANFRSATEYGFGDGDLESRPLPLDSLRSSYQLQPFDVKLIILQP